MDAPESHREPDDDALKCARCGFVGDPVGFRTGRTLLLVKRAVCGRCLEDQARGRARGSSLSLVAWPLGLAGLTVLFWLFDLPELTATAAMLAITTGLFLPAIVLHEVGHVLAGRLCGFEIFEMSLGFGRPVASRWIGDVHVVLRELQAGGLTRGAPPTPRWIRPRHLIFVLGGPAVNLLLIVACVGLEAPMSPPSETGAIPLFMGGFLWANLWVLAMSVLPFWAETLAGRIPSDGLAILRATLLGRPRAQEWTDAYFTFGSLRELERGDRESALGWARRGVETAPDSWILQNTYGVALMEANQAEPAVPVFRALLERDDLEPLMRLLLRNNLAYSLFRADDALDEADAHSRAAIGALPWNPYFNATRGGLLTRLGDVAGGRKHLEEALKRQTEKRALASTHALLALNCVLDGSLSRAREEVAAAERVDPTCELLEEARAALANAA